MVWYSHLFKNFPHFVVIHTVKGFSVVNDAEGDVLLEFPYFFCDPADAGNLISGSSAFLKSTLNIWKFSVHVLLKPGLENFEHYYAQYIISNAGLDEAHPGIKIAERNINNLRYADDTILRAESEEELKSLYMKVKEEREKLA